MKIQKKDLGKQLDWSAKELRKYIGIPVAVKSRTISVEYIQDKILCVHRKNIEFDFLGWSYLGENIQAIYEIKGHELQEPTPVDFVVKYRKGYPTKKSIETIIELYDDPKFWRLRLATNYATYGNKELLFSTQHINDNLLNFIDWATENYGLDFGEIRERSSYITGSVKINKKQ